MGVASAFGIVTKREWRGRRYLISPLVDFLMVGGAGMFLALVMVFSVPTDVINGETAMKYSAILGAIVTYHIFAINYPHFASSYQIMYSRLPYLRKKGGMPAKIRWRYWFAAAGFPALYLVYCAYAFHTTPDNGLFLLGLLVNLMYFTVGWHYCKQCFGILMVLSALKGLYFTVWERRILLAHALLIWLVSCVRGNISINWLKSSMPADPYQYWGVPYRSLVVSDDLSMNLVSWFLDSANILMIFFIAASLTILIRSARRVHKLPSLTAAFGYFMAYPLLVISSSFHPLFLWIIPAVHSFQYWLFVLAYRRGEVAHHYPDRGPDAESAHMPLSTLRWHALGSFVALALFIGAIQFHWMPKLFDAIVNPYNTYHTTALFMMIFHVFFNVHHYFIDNVIWRRENPEVGRNLMGRA